MSDLFGNHIVGFSTRWLKLLLTDQKNVIVVGTVFVRSSFFCFWFGILTNLIYMKDVSSENQTQY